MGRKVVSGHSGRTGRVYINGSELCVTSQKWKEVADEEEVTNSCSAGYAQFEYGNRHVEGSIEADWDIAANPFLDPPLLRAGFEYSMKLYIHSDPGTTPSGPYLDIGIADPSGYAKFNDIDVTVPAKGKVSYSFSFKSSGPYTLPTQASDSTSGA